jgi:hypothetical protein
VLPIPDAVLSRLARFGAFNRGGGVNYHLRARHYAKKLWEPFRWALGEWLLAWHPPEKNLVLVGPSAGYNLQPFLFERFERVIVLEPDPVARWLFQRRLARAPLQPRPRVEPIGEDHFVHHPERLLPLLERNQPCALLFSNVVGQLSALLDRETPDEQIQIVRRAVREALAGRSWASFHDRVSGPLPPNVEGMVRAPRRWSDEEVLARAYDSSPGPLGGERVGAAIELVDHYTEGFFPEALPHAYFRWELGPGVYHLIEAVAAAEPR